MGKILDFAAKTGLVVILHCDIDAMASNRKAPPAYLDALKNLFNKHPETTIIWAHSGLGRYIKARWNHTELLMSLLDSHPNLYVDISRNIVARQFLKGKALKRKWKNFLETYSQRILFGSDITSPTHDKYNKAIFLYKKIWRSLSPPALKNITYKNYKRLFDQARLKVRSWEEKELAEKKM